SSPSVRFIPNPDQRRLPMKSKLAVFFTTGLSLTLLVVSALAQTYITTPAQPGAGAGTANPAVGANQPFPAQPGDFAPFARQPYFTPNAVYGSHGWGHTPAEAELSRTVERLVGQLNDAKSESDKDKLKTQLNEALEKAFD